MMAVPTSCIPEVQGALVHAHQVALGLSPPARAILIHPLPALSDPPPAPSAEVTRPFSRMARKPLQQEPAPLAMTPLCCKQPARSSSRPTGPALGSGQGARPKVSQAPAPASPTGGRWQPPALPQGYTFGSVPPGVTLETRTLAGLPKKSGYRWEQRQRPFVAWSPSQEELWEAYCLLQGEGEWATPEMSYLEAKDSRLQGKAASMRWLCPAPGCAKLSANRLDCQGHYQSTHSGHLSSQLCSCGMFFNNGSTLSTHLDLKHNMEPKWVAHFPPFVALKFVDWVAPLL